MRRDKIRLHTSDYNRYLLLELLTRLCTYQVYAYKCVIRMIRMSYDAFCRPGTGRQKGH